MGPTEITSSEITCARACKNTPGCTHFDYWVSNKNCNKKKKVSVNKTDPFWKGNTDPFCGIVQSNNLLYYI